MTETIGFGEQTRSLYSLEAFKERESGTILKQLYDYWAALPAGAHGLPHENSFRPEKDLPAKYTRRISWIDTRADDPFDYVIKDHAESPIPGMGVELSDKPLCDRPELDMHTTACAVEYLFCKHERTPMYHEIEQLLSGLKRHYTRIMVPLANDAGDVDRIYYATRQLQPIRRISFQVAGAD